MQSIFHSIFKKLFNRCLPPTSTYCTITPKKIIDQSQKIELIKVSSLLRCICLFISRDMKAIYAAHSRQFYKISTKVGTRHLTRGVFVSLYAELEAINKKGETALHRACSFKKSVIRCFAIKGWLRRPH